MKEQDYQYLKALPSEWYGNQDELISVANILDYEGYFKETSEVITFFEKPWHWKKEITKLVEEHEDDLLMENIRTNLQGSGESKSKAYELSFSLFDDVKDGMDSGLPLAEAIIKAEEVLEHET